MANEDKKKPKEASNIFHSIMKASVKPKKSEKMVKDYTHNGHQYWVTVEPAIIENTNKAVFIAYVSDQEPGALLYGTTVKNPDGSVMLFETALSALTNANMIKQSELDSKK